MKKTLSIILAVMLIVLCIVSCDSNTATKKLVSIAITKDPTKTTYKVGESFNKAGMEVTAYYSDGTSGLVTDYTYSPTTAFDKADSRKAITITYQGITAKTTVIVEAPVTSVSLSETEMSVLIGSTKTLVATITPNDAANKKVTWTSSDTSKATVDQNGKVTGIAAGEATITVTTEDGNKTATCTVTVTATAISVTSISLNKSTTSLAINGNETLSVTFNPANATNKNITWTSSDTSKATVDQSGKVTAVAEGTVVIIATTEDGGKSATCTVTVSSSAISVTGISLNKTATTLTVDGEETLSVTFDPVNATNKNITWSSSDENIATVDQTGKVKAKATGAVSIKATTEDGNKTAVCTVTVNAPTKGYASTNDTNRPAEGEVTNACGWVQLWANGPKWAEFNIGSTISNYASANQTSNGETASNNPLYCTANVGGLYTWGGSVDGRGTYSDDHNTESTALTGDADTATKKWGSKWRMPTDIELYQLVYNCTWEWCDGSTTQYITGCTLAGYKVTGNTTGYTSNSIFLPAAGCYLSGLRGQGAGGFCWSSTPANTDLACGLYFYGSTETVANSSRDNGYCVRAILAE